MFSMWKVAVVFTAVNQAGAGLSSLAAGANRAAGALGNVHAKIYALQQAGAAFTNMGEGLGAFFTSGVKGADDFLLSLTKLRWAIPTNYHISDASLQARVVQGSLTYAQSASTIAGEYAMALRSQLTPDQVFGRKSLMPQVMKYADMMKYAYGMSPDESIRESLQLIHQTQSYKTGQVSSTMNLLWKTQQTMPESLATLVRQAKYFFPLGTALGVKPDQLMGLSLLMAQSGLLKGRGGTGVARMFTQSLGATLMTGHLQSRNAVALHNLGMMGADGEIMSKFRNGPGGGLNWDAVVKQLYVDATARRATGRPDLLIKDLVSAFGQTALPMASQLVSPGAYHQWQSVMSAMRNKQTLDQAWQGLQKTPAFQMQRLQASWGTLMQTTFVPMALHLMPIIRMIADGISKLAVAINLHPQIGMAISSAAGGLAVLFTVIGGALSTLASVALFKFGFGGTAAVGGVMSKVLGLVGRLAPGFMFLGTKIIPVIGWILAIAQALAYLMKHPFNVGKFFGAVMAFVQYKFFPWLMNALANGFIAALTAWQNFMNNIVYIVTHPVQDMSSIYKSVTGWFQKEQAGFAQGYRAGMPQVDTRPVDIHTHVHLDSRQIAHGVTRVINQGAARALRTTGGTRNSPYLPAVGIAGAHH